MSFLGCLPCRFWQLKWFTRENRVRLHLCCRPCARLFSTITARILQRVLTTGRCTPQAEQQLVMHLVMLRSHALSRFVWKRVRALAKREGRCVGVPDLFHIFGCYQKTHGSKRFIGPRPGVRVNVDLNFYSVGTVAHAMAEMAYGKSSARLSHSRRWTLSEEDVLALLRATPYTQGHIRGLPHITTASKKFGTRTRLFFRAAGVSEEDCLEQMKAVWSARNTKLGDALAAEYDTYLLRSAACKMVHVLHNFLFAAVSNWRGDVKPQLRRPLVCLLEEDAVRATQTTKRQRRI
eukprot:TRINITY_DN23834_c1_g1_i18.p1 TRINITY_DN23834_c1_g1~~TRINITY_DN23834_c1_g1_i18.p1  ORF type:complete len:292 (+),score=24.79 TRINITY_DN23834_c1_g1_i18:561-1436(+)